MRHLCRLSWLIFSLPFSVSCTLTTLCSAHGAYHDVVAQITQELEINPEDAGLRFKLACAHQEHGEWTSALVEVEKVERLAPGKHPTGFVQGQALASGGHWLAAKSTLDEFITQQPNHAAALAERAKVLRRLNKLQEALADFRTALENAGPGDSSVPWYLQAADAFIANHQVEEAARLLRQGLEKLHENPELLHRSLEVELSAGHFDEALARVIAMEKIGPRREPWMARRAQVLAQAGRLAESHAAWRALRDHLMSLPSLERGTPLLRQLLTEAQRGSGDAVTAPVLAPPSA